jgi:hypothetical protein
MSQCHHRNQCICYKRDCKSKVGLAKDKGNGYTPDESMHTIEINVPVIKEIILD